MYKVSILVPVYNAERFIERCARSLFEQTYPDIEYVFVDDCSPDASIPILQKVAVEYSERKEQIKLVVNERNRGASLSKNIAIENATGEFVCFVDADDWMEVNAVELLVIEQLKTNADVVWGKALMHTDNDQVELCEPHYKDKQQLLLCYCRFTTGLVMTNWKRIIRRKLFVKYDIKSADGFNYSEDKLLMSQVAYYAQSFSTIDDLVYHYNRQNGLSATAQQLNNSFNLDIFRQEYGSLNLIEAFFSDKETVYYEEAVKAKFKYLKGKMDEALYCSSHKGFRAVVNCINTSNPKYWGEIGWNSWKRAFYENYYYMRYFPKVKRSVKRMLGKAKIWVL